MHRMLIRRYDHQRLSPLVSTRNDEGPYLFDNVNSNPIPIFFIVFWKYAPPPCIAHISIQCVKQLR